MALTGIGLQNPSSPRPPTRAMGQISPTPLSGVHVPTRRGDSTFTYRRSPQPGGRWRFSERGKEPRWGKDGRELFSCSGQPADRRRGQDGRRKLRGRRVHPLFQARSMGNSAFRTTCRRRQPLLVNSGSVGFRRITLVTKTGRGAGEEEVKGPPVHARRGTKLVLRDPVARPAQAGWGGLPGRGTTAQRDVAVRSCRRVLSASPESRHASSARRRRCPSFRIPTSAPCTTWGARVRPSTRDGAARGRDSVGAPGEGAAAARADAALCTEIAGALDKAHRQGIRGTGT